MESFGVMSDVANRRANATVIPQCVVTIPVRNEAQRIVACLEALARQSRVGQGSLGVLLTLNGCNDSTRSKALECMARCHLPIRMVEVELPAGQNHAGGARAAALTLALRSLHGRSDGVILTTDADSRVPMNWASIAIDSLRHCDVVAGEIVIDDAEFRLLPVRLQKRCRLEDAYGSLLAQVDALCDPQPHDAWPCHRRRSGANLGFRAAALSALPVLPSPSCGEDRALVEACLARDLRVRHEPALRVTTSARLTGRAPGGMADTLRYRRGHPRAACDPSLEHLRSAVRRFTLRAEGRRIFRANMSARTLATALGMETCGGDAPCRYFGQVWQALEQSSSSLARVPLHPSDIPREISEASAWLRQMDETLTDEEVAA